jgi:hypothetical protein
MKLTKKQEEIKAKILAGTHVLLISICEPFTKEKALECLNSIKKADWWVTPALYGIDNMGNFNFLFKHEINDRPIINMSEWFEEEVWNETPTGFRTPTDDEIESIRTKDMREYDEKLLLHYNVYVIKNDLEENLPRARKEFFNKRYPNEALLKEKAEIEQRLKEIEEQLGGEG